MAKETVVVFEGEDKFIAPRNKSFDKEAGESQFVGETKEPTNPDKQAFDDYMTRKATPVIMPSPVEPDFCKRMKEFIDTRGDGRATSEMVMEAYQMFQDNCVEKPKDNRVIENPIAAPVEPPAVTEKVKEADVTPASVSLPPFVPLSVPTLGVRPSGKGGGEEQKKEEKPSSNVNVILLAVLGLGILYLVTRKSD